MIKAYFNHYILLGIIASLLVFYGNIAAYPQLYYIGGSFALLIVAVHYRLLYFIALQLILASGHFALLLGLSPYTQKALPILLSLQLLIFYLMIGKENSVFLLTGIVGIALLSLGFSYHNQWVLFFGSTGVAAYAYYNAYKTCPASYIWAILNTSFALKALYKLFFY